MDPIPSLVSDAAPAAPAVGWLRGVVVDAIDPERLGAFWQAVLGVGLSEREPGWLELRFGARGSLMAFQPVEPIAHAPGRIRIDVEVDDLDGATERVVALGGTLRKVVRFKAGEEHRVMTDPEGNEFNLVLPFPPDHVP